jgi:hypothetical protein
LWRLGLANKKPRRRQGFFEEHVQESVLVSTLKRCSTLLTQIKIRALNCDWSLLPDSLVTGTVPLTSVGSCRGSPAAGSAQRWRFAEHC